MGHQILYPIMKSQQDMNMRVRFIVDQQDQSLSNLNQSILLKSKNLSKNYLYIKYDFEGNTCLALEPIEYDQKYSYRKVHLQKYDVALGERIDWKKDLQTLKSLMKSKEKIVFRSLRRLYQLKFRPNFFSQADQVKSIPFKQFNLLIPMCLYEMDHLSLSHIKSLFITQNYNEQGLYQFTINQDGRFRVITVNDMVPVFQQTNQHVWGIQETWKMVVLKVWACLNQGYSKIISHHHVPFKFLEYFSSNNWKYYNLQREGLKWFNKFKQSIKISYIVLQTKNSQDVRKIGLAPGIAAYNIVQVNTNSKGQSQFQVKSRFKHKWKGRLNLPNYPGKILSSQQNSFKLQKNFILTKKQFFEIFGCAYITSLSKASTHISDYFKIQVPNNYKNAIYLRFNIKKEGFLDFSFIQSYKNKKLVEGSQSIIDYSIYMKQTGKTVEPQQKYRYLKCKYMLIRKLNPQQKVFQSRISQQSRKSQPQLTSRTKYQAYQVDYLRGYNKGEANFLMMQPGEYYFRLKSQQINKEAIYYLNYCSSERLKIQEVEIEQQLKQQIFQNSILSLLPACVKYKTKNLLIYSGDKFDEMGYGFLVLQNINKAEKSSTVLFSINLKELQKEGFKLKGKKYQQFGKNNKVQFQVKLNQYLILIFKKIQPQVFPNYYWPPKSIQAFDAMKLQENQKNKT